MISDRTVNNLIARDTWGSRTPRPRHGPAAGRALTQNRYRLSCTDSTGRLSSTTPASDGPMSCHPRPRRRAARSDRAARRNRAARGRRRPAAGTAAPERSRTWPRTAGGSSPRPRSSRTRAAGPPRSDAGRKRAPRLRRGDVSSASRVGVSKRWKVRSFSCVTHVVLAHRAVAGATVRSLMASSLVGGEPFAAGCSGPGVATGGAARTVGVVGRAPAEPVPRSR